MEYLTEKQLIEDGPIMIDVDLHYSPNIKQRQHSIEHITDGLCIYMDKCGEILDIPDDTSVEIFIMEKPNVNCLPEKTKDGIHIIIGLSMHKAGQVLLRERVSEELKAMWDDLPIINEWDDVLDEGIVKGYTNWQLYGSRKPGHEAYKLTNHVLFTKSGGEWSMREKDITKFDLGTHIRKLSARYSDYPKYDFSEDAKTIVEDNKNNLNNKKTKTKSAKDKTLDNATNLDNCIDDMFENLESLDYKLKETHDYTMALPESYYGPGSHNKWIRVGWALASTSPKLFTTWLKFMSRDVCRDTLKGADGKFDWSNVPEMRAMWDTFGSSENADGLTNRSIIYWCKRDAEDKYREIHKATVDYYIFESISSERDKKDRSATEYDISRTLYHMYKDEFVCVSIKNNCWYEYKTQRWFENDSGNSLRLKISGELHSAYLKCIMSKVNYLHTIDQTDPAYEVSQYQLNKLCDIANYLKKTQWKNNIMKEARELFFDGDFMNKLDQNPYLLCFNNCIIDFKEKVSRKGRPDDYISKCTNIDYVKLDEVKHYDTICDIKEFFKQLFPDEELCRYMWEHLASCCVGTNENQTFNIYTGSGRNGKSKLAELMTKALGEYKATVPITLITQKRNSIGSTSSEIVQLKGARYAVMQEPSKGDKINEGIMKEITGGDPIQGRALFKDTITFVPEFKLVVCTNTLFDIKSNDDGTWRRIRVCDFVSKFLEKPYEDEDKFPKSSFPHQFKIDTTIEQKFVEWAPILMSMFVNISYEKQGKVTDCDIVMRSSDKYREGQDYMTEFDKECIKRVPDAKLKKTVVLSKFREWYESNYGRGNIPKGKELHEYLDTKYGRNVKGKWNNVMIIEDEVDNDNVVKLDTDEQVASEEDDELDVNPE
tara:strand:+ start:79 stop:2724 length:2646 start_codon:yes stop_codon:yes gene_type:complete